MLYDKGWIINVVLINSKGERVSKYEPFTIKELLDKRIKIFHENKNGNVAEFTVVEYNRIMYEKILTKAL